MKRKNTKKFLGVLALICMLAVGASAWLVNHEVATGVNNIKVGSISIEFTNEQNAISLSGNNAIPMTKEYAIANTTPYTFTIHNDGSMAVNYQLFIEPTTYSNTFNQGDVYVVVAEVEENATLAEMRTALSTAPSYPVRPGGKASGYVVNFAVDAEKYYALVPVINDSVTLSAYDNKAITFGLRVDAEQYGIPTVRINQVNYEDHDGGVIRLHSTPMQMVIADIDDVKIDGVSLDLSGATAQYDTVIFTNQALASGSHSWLVVYDGVEYSGTFNVQ